MNFLLEAYIFYVDIYFIQNFFIKVTVLYLSFFINKLHSFTSNKRGVFKIVGAAMLGTVLEIAGLMFIKPYELFLVMAHLMEVPILMLLLLRQEKRKWFQLMISGYFFTMIVNGIVEYLWNYFGEKGGYLFLVMISCGTACVGIRIWGAYSRYKKGIYQIKLIHKGKEIRSFGYYDSGNRLRDPYSQKGVHVVSEELLQKLITEEDMRLCVPYHSLGNENGIMDIVYMDAMHIEGKKETVKLQKIPVGFTKESLFAYKPYKIILNEEVF